MDVETIRTLVYASLMTAGVLLVGGFVWREWDRRMDKVLMLDTETKEPKVRRYKVTDGTFTWKRGSGLDPLKVSIPSDTDNAVFHRRSAASVYVIDEKGHVLAVSSKDDKGRDSKSPMLRVYDAAHYQRLSETELVRKAIQAYDKQPQGFDRTTLIIALVVAVVLVAGAFFLGRAQGMAKAGESAVMLMQAGGWF